MIKKIIARVILVLLFVSSIGALLWKLIIQPCIELYSKHGILGVGAWFLALVIIISITYCFLKFIDWCIDNAE